MDSWVLFGWNISRKDSCSQNELRQDHISDIPSHRGFHVHLFFRIMIMAGVSWGSYSKWLLGEHETISLEVCPLASGEKPLGLANFCEIRWKVDFSFSRCSNFKLFTRPILFVWWGLAMFPNIFVCGTWPFEPWRRFFWTSSPLHASFLWIFFTQDPVKLR